MEPAKQLTQDRELEKVIRLAAQHMRQGTGRDDAWRVAYVERGAAMPGVRRKTTVGKERTDGEEV